ncbi:flagellar protein FlaG [Desulfonispora thiosulfatigenes DSM 11270]|uniref:Flagellar protein FlaG n=1 Tax=Desulfonispora thiosulfatigenes DSM 11270 TaxID=656914 RepID=A0A1W1UNU8_DESTI|nr:flagellar protein FlaG [Desulfonispora thiosulfatigenes]SMB82782.1 flagellar protein FlaG [Desulfonispora thiosulfatigenes DSM 11270]
MKVTSINSNSPVYNDAFKETNRKQEKENIQVVKSKDTAGSEEKKYNEENKYKAEQIIKAIETANKSLELTETRFEYSIHEKTKEIMVKVIDKNNDEVIREIPSEKILDMVASMWDLAGIFVDEKV